MSRLVREEYEAQRKDEERRAHRAKMAEIERKLKQREAQVKEMEQRAAMERM